MARKLPDEPTKRRKQIFKHVYQNMEHWRALQEDRGMSDVISVEGEDIYFGDLMVGFGHLPHRQQQAFERICLKGYTEAAARDELLPNSKSSTPVQQYADSGLVRMIAAYDAKQAGRWPPPVVPKKPKQSRRRKLVAALLTPFIRKGLEDMLTDVTTQIEELKQSQLQLEQMLGITGVATLAAHRGTSDEASTKGSANNVPAPNPRPEGKPRVEDAAKELVDASL